MKNGESTLKPRKEVPINFKLEVIQEGIGKCALGCLIFYIPFFIYSVVNKKMCTGYVDFFFGTVNVGLWSEFIYLWFYGILVLFVIIVFFCITYLTMKPIVKLYFLITTSMLILIGHIYMTGGFLDSPFSGVLAVYITCFFVMNDDKKMKVYNIWVLVLIVIVNLFPYLRFDIANFLFKYKDERAINLWRFILSGSLVLLAGYTGHRVNRKLSEKYNEINEIKVE